MKVTAADTRGLPISERIQLVTEIWESIAECPDQIQLTEATKELLIRRLEASRQNPDLGSPWEEVKSRILNG